MSHYVYRFVVLLSASFLAAPTNSRAQETAPTILHSLGDARPQPWTSLNLDRSSQEFQFAIVSDNSGTPRPGIWREAMTKLNLLQPAFVMSVGDLIEGYVNDSDQLNKQWDLFLSDLAPLQAPFFFVAGNHDVGRPLWFETYRQRIGPTWYYFVYSGVLMLVLDTNDGPEHGTGMSDEQIAWAEEVLQQFPASAVRWTIVFQHKPLWNDQHSQWKRLNRMLADREKVTVFAGHIHNYQSTLIDGVEYVAMATTGGGSTLRGKEFGELDHIAWVTVKNEGPVVANIALDGILPIDFRTNETAKQFSAITQGTFLQTSLIQLDGSEFQRGVATLTVTNPEPQPMRFRTLMEPAAGVVVRPAAISTVIPPSESYSVELALEADSPVPLPQLQPTVLHWTVAYDRQAAASLEWLGQHQIQVDGTHRIPAARGMVVDGDLNDWSELEFKVDRPAEIRTNPQAWRGESDANFRFAVAADDHTLYVAIDVEDDQVSHNGDMLWQDFAGVMVNPLVGSQATADQIKKAAFSVVAGLSLSADDRSRYESGKVPVGVQSSVGQTEGHVIYEFAIPTAGLDKANHRWQRLQLNFMVNDHDPGDERSGISILYWRPRWDGPHQHPGLGIFERRAAD